MILDVTIELSLGAARSVAVSHLEVLQCRDTPDGQQAHQAEQSLRAVQRSGLGASRLDADLQRRVSRDVTYERGGEM